jgi:hypothetical protein
VITPLPAGWFKNYRDNHQPHQLYRCYDADGVLLYIGCTSHVERRMSGHLATSSNHGASPWLRACMDHYEADADVYVGRIAGQTAEAEAIRAERPLFNVQHNYGRPSAKVDTASCLIDRGHVELARATACTCWRETREAGARDVWCSAHRDEDRPLFQDVVES